MTLPEPTSASVRAAAVIVAAGRGERLGEPAKVLLPLAGRPMLAYALDAVERAETVRDVILVAGEHTRATIEDLVAAGPWDKVVAIVVGGARRQDSVAAGVGAVTAEREVVVIHDGARPLAPPALFDRCAVVAAAVGAAIAAVPVADTLKRVDAQRVVATIPRAGLWAAQTPQAFRREMLAEALASPRAAAETFTDEAGLLEALGHPVAVVPGARANVKVTHADDLAVAEALLAHGHDPAFPLDME